MMAHLLEHDDIYKGSVGDLKSETQAGVKSETSVGTQAPDYFLPVWV